MYDPPPPSQGSRGSYTICRTFLNIDSDRSRLENAR